MVDWQIARNESNEDLKPSGTKSASADDKYDRSDDDSSASDHQTSYMKTRSGRNVSMAQKKDQ